MDRRPSVGLVRARAAAQVVLVGVGVAVMTTPALAADASWGGPSAVYQPSSVPAGADVSYPQCGLALPLGQAFVVVGVNGGRANTLNPCLGEELAWAVYRTTGASPEPNLSLYLNTGDPGNSYLGQPVPDWPDSGATPYGVCLPTIAEGHLHGPGQNSAACAWEFGYQRAAQDLFWLQTAAAQAGLPTRARAYPWWLDVETSNTWQPATLLNLADLQGMVYSLRQAGANRLGVYAFPPQWEGITGGTPTLASGSLYPLSDWILGSGSLAAAQASCQQPAFTGGRVEITQFPSGGFDGDYAC